MLEVRGLCKSYINGSGNKCNAVKDVSFSVGSGEIVGLTGASGCGKTTLARMISGLCCPDMGSIIIDGVDTNEKQQKGTGIKYGPVQLIFQHPDRVLDPRMTLKKSILEGIRANGSNIDDEERYLEKIIKMVSLPSNLLNRYPTQVSGGEIQRASFSRVIATKPKYLILDEATSMLDISIQARIIQTVVKLAEEGSGIIIISHDLDLIRSICDRVIVMNEGTIIEQGKTDIIFKNPGHIITKELVSCVELLFNGKGESIQ